MPLWLRVARIWLPIAVATTVLTGLIYLGVQQDYRMSLNDPQIQLAQDGAAMLDAGAAPESVAGTVTVDVDRSLAPFVIVFAKDNSVIAGSARLDGAVPKPPSGVLNAARTSGVNTVTWQPRAGVRIASASAAAKDGRVVLAGRNMREVEKRIDTLTLVTALAWAAAMIGVVVATVVVELVADRLARA
jgi:hypothetical protein